MRAERGTGRSSTGLTSWRVSLHAHWDGAAPTYIDLLHTSRHGYTALLMNGGIFHLLSSTFRCQAQPATSHVIKPKLDAPCLLDCM